MIRAAVVALIAIAPVSALAHPGGLDASGGHHDRKNGGYHSHRSSSSGSQSPPKQIAAYQVRTQARTTARTTAREEAPTQDRRTMLAEDLSPVQRAIPVVAGDQVLAKPVVESRAPLIAATRSDTPASVAEVRKPDPRVEKWNRESRTWTSVSGSTLRARLVSTVGRDDERVVSLERESGVVQKVSITKLSWEDRLYVDDWHRRRS